MINLSEQIKGLIIDVNSNANGLINNDDNLFEMGVLDSLTMVQFIVSLENKFKFKIANREINYETFTTVNEIEKFLKPRIA